MTDPKRVVLFGDLLLRLDVPGLGRLTQASTLEARFTGAEANVGVSLVNFGHHAVVVSRVPDNAIGDACLGYLRRFGLDVSRVVRGAGRLGLFYVETGAAQRPSSIIYDRAASSFATSGPSDYDWPAILDGADWLHFSGTAPAMGDGVVAAIGAGIREARARGIRVSCDLNYRTRLWTAGAANRVLSPLVQGIDMLISNEEDVERVFGIRPADSDVVAGRLAQDGYASVARQLTAALSLGDMATTLRESVSASHNRWSALLHSGARTVVSRTYDIDPVVDRIGAGDAFAGALIHGTLEGLGPQRRVEFAAAASCLKHSIPGDFNLVSVSEVDDLLRGDGSGRIRR